MPDQPNAPSQEAPSLDAELDRLKIKGRDSEPERVLVIFGVVLFILGVVGVIFALQSAHTSSDVTVQNEKIIMAIGAAMLGLAGVVIWARYSMTRYLRYWLLRVIFEQRYQQDRSIEVLERISSKLDK